MSNDPSEVFSTTLPLVGGSRLYTLDIPPTPRASPRAHTPDLLSLTLSLSLSLSETSLPKIRRGWLSLGRSD